jgi:NAD(P)-dependent dehydrogenase (short-subunit alcohol dehydrogenase family)
MQRTKGYAPARGALAGKVALVTGAARGLGLTTAEAYLEAGAQVALLDRDVEELERAAQELSLAGFEPLMIQGDIRSEDDVDAAVARIVRELGRIDVLVNNAAVLMGFVRGEDPERPVFWEIDSARWRELWEINVTGTWLCARRVAREMIAVGRGSIINMTTSRGTMTSERHIPYGPSKAAIAAFTRAGARQLKPHGVRMNALLPGAATNRRGESERRLNAWDVMVPAAVYLASDASASMTGQSIIADEFNRSRGLPAPYVAAGE